MCRHYTYVYNAVQEWAVIGCDLSLECEQFKERVVRSSGVPFKSQEQSGG